MIKKMINKSVQLHTQNKPAAPPSMISAPTAPACALDLPVPPYSTMTVMPLPK